MYIVVTKYYALISNELILYQSFPANLLLIFLPSRGGMGFSSDTKISRFYRDLRLLSIGGGTDETMLAIICKYMGTLPKLKK